MKTPPRPHIRRLCALTARTALLALCLQPAQLLADPPPGSWTLTFDENFNGTTLDSARWNKGMRWADAINNELQAYRPENVTVAGGYCTIAATKVRGFINKAGGYPANTTVLTVDGFTQAITNGTILTIPGQSRKFKTVSTVGGTTPTQITILRLTETYADDVGGLTDPISDNAEVIVTAKMSDGGGYQWGAFDYRSGAIQTWGKWKQTYGYFEVRARMTSAKGTWPAAWLMPDRGPTTPPNIWRQTAVGNTWARPDGSDPDELPDETGTCPMGTEIDIFEYMGTWKNPATGLSKSHCGYIWKYGQTGAVYSDYTMVDKLRNPDTEFHTYGVYWAPGKMVFYLDGHVVLGRNDLNYVSVVPQYWILNCAMSTNDWTTTPVPLSAIDAGLPSNMVIDYVKAYTGTATDFVTHEAESVTTVTSSDPISNISEAGASNGSYEILGANLANDHVTYTLPVPAKGVYTVHVGVKRANSRGKFQLSIDGVNVGDEQNLYSDSAGFRILDVGTVIVSSTGNKQFKFTVTGKDAASSGFGLGIDFIRLYPEAAPKFEAEAIATATATDTVTLVSEIGASAGVFEMLEANADNDSITYTVPVAAPGTYNVRIGVKRAASRGIFQLTVDGVNHGSTQDLYRSVADYYVFDLGPTTFATAGNKQFKFTVTGKNPSSSSRWLALDYIELKP